MQLVLHHDLKQCKRGKTILSVNKLQCEDLRVRLSISVDSVHTCAETILRGFPSINSFDLSWMTVSIE